MVDIVGSGTREPPEALILSLDHKTKTKPNRFKQMDEERKRLAAERKAEKEKERERRRKEKEAARAKRREEKATRKQAKVRLYVGFLSKKSRKA